SAARASSRRVPECGRDPSLAARVGGAPAPAALPNVRYSSEDSPLLSRPFFWTLLTGVHMEPGWPRERLLARQCLLNSEAHRADNRGAATAERSPSAPGRSARRERPPPRCRRRSCVRPCADAVREPSGATAHG